MDLIAFFVTIHGSHCIIQLTFTFIYSTFSKKLVKKAIPKQTLSRVVAIVYNQVCNQTLFKLF